MRKVFAMALLLLVTAICLRAQDGNQGLPAKNAIPNIIPPTPEAAALGRFGGNTIGMVTGTATYSVPLYTIKAGSLSIPLSVSYASNGVKVDEIASRVGMQWKIDFAGIINKTVIGDPDEQPSFRAATHLQKQWGKHVISHKVLMLIFLQS